MRTWNHTRINIKIKVFVGCSNPSERLLERNFEKYIKNYICLLYKCSDQHYKINNWQISQWLKSCLRKSKLLIFQLSGEIRALQHWLTIIKYTMCLVMLRKDQVTVTQIVLIGPCLTPVTPCCLSWFLGRGWINKGQTADCHCGWQTSRFLPSKSTSARHRDLHCALRPMRRLASFPLVLFFFSLVLFKQWCRWCCYPDSSSPPSFSALGWFSSGCPPGTGLGRTGQHTGGCWGESCQFTGELNGLFIWHLGLHLDCRWNWLKSDSILNAVFIADCPQFLVPVWTDWATKPILKPIWQVAKATTSEWRRCPA